MKKYFILLILLSSCSSVNVSENSTKMPFVPLEIRPYVEDFLLGLKENRQSHNFDRALLSLKINLVPVVRNPAGGFSENALGRCFLKESLIEIDKEYWSHLPEDKRQIAIDHELGHCLLKRVHRNIYDEKRQMVSSVMSSIDRDFNYGTEKKRLRQELFNKKFYGTLIILTEMTEHQSDVFNKAFVSSTHRYEAELNGDLPLSPEAKLLVDYFNNIIINLIYR